MRYVLLDPYLSKWASVEASSPEEAERSYLSQCGYVLGASGPWAPFVKPAVSRCLRIGRCPVLEVSID